MEQRRRTPPSGKAASRKRRRRLNPRFLMLLTIAAAVVLFCCAVVAIILSSCSAEDLQQEAPAAAKVQLWFDTEDEKTKDAYQMQLPQMPGVVFKRNAQQILLATDDGETKVLVEGSQVHNGYFCDLSGDGVPELCATVMMGTGIVDSRVWVYDPVSAKVYMLEDRLNFDYSLTFEDNILLVNQRKFASRNVVAKGAITLKDEAVSFAAAADGK